MTELTRLIAVAKGDEPADLVLANARVVNTSTVRSRRAMSLFAGAGWPGWGIIRRQKRCWI